MTTENTLKTNHNIRVVNLTTGDNVLCIFGEIPNQEDPKNIVGYKMIYPYKLFLGELNEDGSFPIKYERWCPFSPIEEHNMSGNHIISVVFPDNSILENYVSKLKQVGLNEEQIFYPEETDGDNSEPVEDSE